MCSNNCLIKDKIWCYEYLKEVVTPNLIINKHLWEDTIVQNTSTGTVRLSATREAAPLGRKGKAFRNLHSVQHKFRNIKFIGQTGSRFNFVKNLICGGHMNGHFTVKYIKALRNHITSEMEAIQVVAIYRLY